MNNYFIIGHSSGIGQAISQNISPDNRVYATHFKNKPGVLSNNVSTLFLNVLDDKLDLSFTKYSERGSILPW